MKRFLVIAGLLACSLLPARGWETLPSRTNGTPGFVYNPSPEDWRDAVIYQVVTDRFCDGDPANNDANPDGAANPYAADGIHGGDFRGLEQKLDYVRMLGGRALWISPVLRNVNGAYHGYYTLDFNQVDPHWGTLEELCDLVDAAHERGLYVILDVVLNHMGRLLTSDDPGYPAFHAEGYRMRWKDPARRFAPPFDDLGRFHHAGSIENWEDPAQRFVGAVRGLPDLRTEDERVRNDLLKSYIALVAATDCDGFRVDSAWHIAPADWDAILPGLYAACAAMGKTNFLCFGEALRYNDREVASLTRGARFNSMMDYPLYDRMQKVFVEGRATRLLTRHEKDGGAYAARARGQLVVFLDNHDTARVMSPGRLAGDVARLKVALAWLFTGPHVPCLYYGTEQGFDGAQGHHAREDMFDGEFESGPSAGDRFDYAQELYAFVRKLALLRETYAPLRRGTFEERWSSKYDRGLYIFSRIAGEEEVLVALNTADEAREARFLGRGVPTGYEEGTVLVNVLEPRERVVVGRGGGSSRVVLTVPARGVKVFVSEERVETLRPSVVQCAPPHDSYGNATDTEIVLTFDQPMATQSVVRAFSIIPRRAGSFAWNREATECIFCPDEPLPRPGRVRIRLDGGAASRAGKALGAAFEGHFYTQAEPRHLSPLGDYLLDGKLDAGVPEVAAHGGLAFYARFDPASGALYVATAAAGDGRDRFILLDDELAEQAKYPAPWAKAGRVAGDGPFLADENDNAFAAWRGVRASAEAAAEPGGVLEGVLNLRQQYGRIPRRLFLAVASYGTEEGGALAPDAQVPAPVDGDGDVGPDEYYRLELAPAGAVSGGR